MTDTLKPEPGTPLPWSFEEHRPESGYFGNIIGYTGKLTEMGKPLIRTITIQLKNGGAEEARANARYIVHACNEHPKLIAALREAQPYVQGAQGVFPKSASALLRTIDNLLKESSHGE